MAPGIARRLASLAYEAMLLFAVAMIAGYLYSSLTQQRHALTGRTGLQVFLFLVIGLYFVWFWTHGGQTVAMKAWRLRLVDAGGAPVGPARAVLRYFAAWVWLLPALITAYRAQAHSLALYFLAPSVGIVAYALCALLRPDRQFWHDALCGTRVISWQTPAKASA